MTPQPVDRVKSPTVPVKEPESPEKTVASHVPALEESTKPITILSELDSYISERMKGQPKTLEEVDSRIQTMELKPRHRLELPQFFEERSADHQAKPGPYVFRWLFKDKRAIDRALNVQGWMLVNRTYFPQAPRYVFTANGGVEVGDAILAFMPVKQALAIRAEPARRSQERLKAQMTPVSSDYVMMTGNPNDNRVYQPDLGEEATESPERKVTGVMTEGRDF